MALDEGRDCGEGYPPEYYEVRQEVRASRVTLICWLLISGGGALCLGWGYVHDVRPALLFSVAPLAALMFLVLLLFTPGTLDSIRVVAILPYFHKSHPGVSGGCSFLSGIGLARNCAYLDVLAQEAGLEPLSYFGFADDLHGGRVIWHEPERGLRTVSGLRAALRQDPSLLQEADAVSADLALIEANLQDAVRLQAPFCLLLRYGATASGHEMDMRQGYFCYG